MTQLDNKGQVARESLNARETRPPSRVIFEALVKLSQGNAQLSRVHHRLERASKLKRVFVADLAVREVAM